MAEELLKFRNLFASKTQFVCKRFMASSVPNMDSLSNWQLLTHNMNIHNDSQLFGKRFICPFGKRVLCINDLILESNLIEDDYDSEFQAISIQLKKKIPLTSSKIPYTRLLSLQDVASIPTSRIPNTQDESSEIWGKLQSLIVDFRIASHEKFNWFPNCATPILACMEILLNSTSGCEKVDTISEGILKSKSVDFFCPCYYSMNLFGTEYDDVTSLVDKDKLDSILEVQVWIDCPCFGNIDSCTAFVRRVGDRNIDCSNCFVSDALLTLRRDCFTLYITKQFSNSTSSSFSNSIPLSYLHNSHKKVLLTDSSSMHSVENLTIFELFELYREEAFTLFYFHRQFYDRLHTSFNSILPHRCLPHLAVQNRESPHKLELILDGCKFTALYMDSSQPFIQQEEKYHQLPVWKVSAVFSDRTILRWDTVLKQVLNSFDIHN